MNKKVAFKVKSCDENEIQIVRTVLTMGYSCGDVTYVADPLDDDGTIVQFDVNKMDLKDLRHDAEVLRMAGVRVQEVEPL